MPRTVIIRKTWRCPVCDAEWDSSAYNTLPCPYCGQGVVRIETNPARCGTLTVMGYEDIEEEILERDEATYRTRGLAGINAQAAAIDAEGEFATPVAMARFITRRIDDMEQKIASLKLEAASGPTEPTFRPQGYFLRTPADITAYRSARRADIAAAIIVAMRSAKA